MTGERDAVGQPAAGPVASVVIPAHNEARVIGRCLDALRAGAPPGALETLVVCNGCADDTADIARRAGVRVLETPRANKAAALNLGDAAASCFPRFYVDADVVVSGAALLTVADALRTGECLAAAPRMTVDLAGTSWAVRSYYRIWMRLPYATSDHVGSGVVGLSAQGRSRFDRLPDAIADDYFLYSLFAPGERRTVQDVTFTVFPARTARHLIRRKTRVFAGNLQLRDQGHARPRHGDDRGGGLAAVLAADPRLLVALPAFAGISAAAKVLARRKVARGGLGSWERDESSRTGVELR